MNYEVEDLERIGSEEEESIPQFRGKEKCNEVQVAQIWGRKLLFVRAMSNQDC